MARLFAAALVGILIPTCPQTSGAAPPNPVPSEPPAARVPGEVHSDVGVNDSLLATTAAQQRVIAAFIERETEVAIARARQRAATDPAAAEVDLKTVLHYVATAPELTASERAGLRGRLEGALREARRRQIERDQSQFERQAAAAASRPPRWARRASPAKWPKVSL